jgi:hypothetical protein
LAVVSPSELKFRMTASKGQRNWFQIHLSTAVVLMIAAGGIIWAHMTEQLGPDFMEASDGEKFYTDGHFGWPFMAHFSDHHRPLIIGRYGPGDEGFINYSKTYYSMAALDLAVALLILFALWVVCEWWIRPRAARNGV